jgi:type IV pilus assembly protein PilC
MTQSNDSSAGRPRDPRPKKRKNGLAKLLKRYAPFLFANSKRPALAVRRAPVVTVHRRTQPKHGRPERRTKKQAVAAPVAEKRLHPEHQKRASLRPPVKAAMESLDDLLLGMNDDAGTTKKNDKKTSPESIGEIEREIHGAQAKIKQAATPEEKKGPSRQVESAELIKEEGGFMSRIANKRIPAPAVLDRDVGELLSELLSILGPRRIKRPRDKKGEKEIDAAVAKRELQAALEDAKNGTLLGLSTPQAAEKKGGFLGFFSSAKNDPVAVSKNPGPPSVAKGDAFLRNVRGGYAVDSAKETSLSSAEVKEGREMFQEAAGLIKDLKPKKGTQSDAAREKEAARVEVARKEDVEIQRREDEGKLMDETLKIAREKAKKIAKHKHSGFAQFLAALSHIGLGKERTVFVQTLAMMLNAGLPLIDAIKTLQAEVRTKPMKKLIQRILDQVENGSPLWRAMDSESFFSPSALALIRIGEEAGNLAQNMEHLSAQEEKDHELKGKVKMAMIYPSIVLVLMFVVIMGLGLFVLPNLIQVLYSLNVELPLVTRAIIWITNAFTSYSYIMVPGSLGGAALMVILAKFTRFRVVTQWLAFRIPGIGRLAREATIARFGVILGGLLHAGVPVTEALKSLVEVTPIVSYRNFYARLLEHVLVGDTFSKSFASIKGCSKLLPPSVQQLIVTGERSGSLSTIMLKIADIYDKKASETAQKLPVILEPILLLFIGGLVGTIAFAIIVPIYSIVGNVGR